MNVVLRVPCATSMSDSPVAASLPCQFVATALEFWFTSEPNRFARDVQINDTVYRRLDPEYYAWLRSRMVLAKKATAAGHLDAAAFEDLRVRFNAVHEWAVEHFGEERLLEAVRTLRAGEYKPPLAEDVSRRITLPCAPRSTADHISPEAITLVDTIAENAIALGWNRERLYAMGNGIFDPERGLIRYLKPGDRLGEVTAQSIEIIHPLPAEVRHRFYNPDVDQPWIRRGP